MNSCSGILDLDECSGYRVIVVMLLPMVPGRVTVEPPMVPTTV